MATKNIAIAGGSGLIGASLARKISNDSNLPIRCSYHKNKNLTELNKIQFCKADFLSLDSCIKFTKNIHTLFLCAGETGGFNFQQKHKFSIFNTLIMNVNLIKSSILNNVKNIYLFSSSTIYNDKSKLFTENNFDDLKYDSLTIVGKSYLYLESFLKQNLTNTDTKLKIIRPSNVYGENDKVDLFKSNVIPALILKFLNNDGKSIKIFGNGNEQRDFIYSEDLADIVFMLFDKDVNFDILNIGVGYPTKIRELALLIRNLTDNEHIDIKFDNNVTNFSSRILDIKKLSLLIGNYNFTSLNSGLKKTIEWYKKLDEKK